MSIFRFKKISFLLLLMFITFNVFAEEELNDSLNFASEEGNLIKVIELIKKGADVNAVCDDGFGSTPLIQACFKKHKDIVKYLISKGANVNAKLSTGQTALMLAIPSVEIVKLLIENGADVNAKDRDGETALIESADFDYEIVKMLIKKGVDIDAKNNKGVTALMNACTYFSNEKVVKILLNNKANVNAIDNYGRSALIEASITGNKAIVKLLINNGADVNCRIKKDAKVYPNKTALGAAKQGVSPKHKEIVKLLLEAGAQE